MADSTPIAKTASEIGPEMQNTIRRPAHFHGLSLFHGYPVSASVLPAEANTGIVFRRSDLVDAPDIPASVEFVKKVPRRTVLGHDDNVIVETIEHLMAALAGLHVDNAVIELDAPELPSFDGSCIHFCDGILDAGIESQNSAAERYRIRSTSTLHPTENSADASNTIRLRPGLPEQLQVTYHLDYGFKSPLAAQSATSMIDPETFYRDIAKARTFVLESEIKALKAMGFGQHLTAQDLVVVTENGVLDNQLHWENEAARHKILDCVGDFALCGRRMTGVVEANQSGHQMNHKVAAHIASAACEKPKQQKAA